MQASSQSPSRAAPPLDFALPGGASGRGFWTKRRRTATSMLAVLGLIAGIAVAFKLFDQTVPNNVVRDASNFSYSILAKDVAAGETVFRPATGTTVQNSIFLQGRSTAPGTDVDTFPGDSRRSEVQIVNTNVAPAKDATFFAFVEPASIVVTRFTEPSTYTVVPTGSPEWLRFVAFWTLKIDKQTYTTSPACAKGDCAENNPDSDSSYVTACQGGLREINRTAPCSLGTVRAAGTKTGGVRQQDASDDRQYRFTMSETDDGTDQSAFKGWRVTFTFGFQAKLPADTEAGRYSAVPGV